MKVFRPVLGMSVVLVVLAFALAGPASAQKLEVKEAGAKMEEAEEKKEAKGVEYETDYTLGVDSMPQDGVPRGTVEKRTWNESTIYPGTTRDYWVYVPAQYDEAEPTPVMVFLDGADYVHAEGEVRVPTVFDNLIHKGEMPVTIGVFVNPGGKKDAYSNRDVEYVTLSDTYARFLLEEIIPDVAKDYNLVDDAAGRAVCGMSDGGVGAFTVAWERPQAFSKVISHIGSYTRLQRGSEYPYRIRMTRGNPKPIRVFLQDGAHDINLIEGDWTLANILMDSALRFARYDYRFELGTGGHDLRHGGEIFPDTLRWLWRDYPGVKSAYDEPNLDVVVGEWEVESNLVGLLVRTSVLTITEKDGALSAQLHDHTDGELEITAISFKDDLLIYSFKTPESLLGWDKEEGSKGTMEVWARVTGDTFKGALSTGTHSEIDYPITGRKKGGAPDPQ
jgi:enterochelin esterase family protein